MYIIKIVSILIFLTTLFFVVVYVDIHVLFGYKTFVTSFTYKRFPFFNIFSIFDSQMLCDTIFHFKMLITFRTFVFFCFFLFFFRTMFCRSCFVTCFFKLELVFATKLQFSFWHQNFFSFKTLITLRTFLTSVVNFPTKRNVK